MAKGCPFEMLSVCLLTSVCQIKRCKTEVKLEMAPNPHLIFPAPDVGRALLQTSDPTPWLLGHQHLTAPYSSGQENSSSVCLRVSSQLKVRKPFPRPTPTFYIWLLFLQRAGAGAYTENLCIRSTSSQNVQEVYSQIKL